MQNHNRRIGVNPCLYEVTPYEAIDINDAFDFELADHFACKFEGKNDEI